MKERISRRKYVGNKGDTFGVFTFIEEVSPNDRGVRRWKVLCNECQNEYVAVVSVITHPNAKSCGCRRSESTISSRGQNKVWPGEGRRYVKELMSLPGFGSYDNMITRCYNPKHGSYKDYGGRGIKVCDRWLEGDGKGFLNFLEDLGSPPSEKHSLDRIDYDKGYFPDNCRWSTQSKQVYNQHRRSTNSSGRTGVYRKRSKWEACITKNYKTYRLGLFHTFEEAVAAREAAELEYFGELRPEVYKEGNHE